MYIIIHPMKKASFIGFSFEQKDGGPSPLRILGAYVFTETRWEGPPRKNIHPFWVLSCRFTNGELIKAGHISNTWQRILPGTVMLLAPGTRYWQDFSKGSAPVRGAYVVFTGGEFAGLQRFMKRKESIAFVLDPEQLLSKTISNAAQVATFQREGSFFRLQSFLYNMVDRLQNAQLQDEEKCIWSIETPNQSARKDLSFYDQVCDYLSARLSEKITIADIAEHFKLSIPGLFKKYAKESNESPKKTFARLRMEQAKALLMQGEPLKSIADRMGFCDSYHFSKAFKQYSGMSPRKYLKALRSSDDGVFGPNK